MDARRRQESTMSASSEVKPEVAANAAPPSRYRTFSAFYPYYLSEHSNIVCRRLHYAGSALAIGFLITFAVTWRWPWLVAALLVGYAFAWVGHFFFEKNRPATFQYPLYSFIGDWVMLADMLRGRIRF
jgi:hypothetical protein